MEVLSNRAPVKSLMERLISDGDQSNHLPNSGRAPPQKKDFHNTNHKSTTSRYSWGVTDIHEIIPDQPFEKNFSLKWLTEQPPDMKVQGVKVVKSPYVWLHKQVPLLRELSLLLLKQR